MAIYDNHVVTAIIYMKYRHWQKMTDSSGFLSHLFTVDNILPLDSSFVLLLAELVLYCQTP